MLLMVLRRQRQMCIRDSPEGYLSAFSNLYKEIASKINSKNSKKRFYFPTAYEGLLTARFIDGCVKSSSKKKWVAF